MQILDKDYESNKSGMGKSLVAFGPNLRKQSNVERVNKIKIETPLSSGKSSRLSSNDNNQESVKNIALAADVATLKGLS